MFYDSQITPIMHQNFRKDRNKINQNINNA